MSDMVIDAITAAPDRENDAHTCSAINAIVSPGVAIIGDTPAASRRGDEGSTRTADMLSFLTALAA